MLILALDTSTQSGSVAIIKDLILTYEIQLNISITHCERIIPTIQDGLIKSNVTLNDIDVFAIAHGPGSFTGLRIGLSTIKGLCFNTSKPIIPVSSLKALAYNLFASSHLICPILDAKKNEVYSALYKFENDELITLLPENAYIPEELCKTITQTHKGRQIYFVGEGVRTYHDLFNNHFGKNELVLTPFFLNNIRASTIGYLASKKFNQGLVCSVETIEANYLRISEAERKKNKLTPP